MFSIDNDVIKFLSDANSWHEINNVKYPIWFMSKPGKDNKPSDTTIRAIQLFDELAKKYSWPVTVFTGAEGKESYQKTFSNCRILCHEFNKLEVKQHVTSMIQNSMMRCNVQEGNQWMFIMNDDVLFTRVYSSEEKSKTIDNADDLFCFLKIWQYQNHLASKQVKKLGFTSMPVVHKNDSRELQIDDIRVCQAFLLNAKELVENDILVTEKEFIWEDFDLFINAAYHGISAVGINWPIHFYEIRKMFSSESSVRYDIKRLSALTINLYKKWGKHIIPYFRPNLGTPGAIHMKVGSCKKWMENGCKIEVDDETAKILDDFMDDKVTYEEVLNKLDFRNDYNG